LQATSTSDLEIIKQILEATRQREESVYSPREDSFLMLHAISQLELEGMTVCDMGTGSGILGLFCALKGASVTVTDIDELALTQTVSTANRLGLKVKAIQSDLFSRVNEKFDLILFNAPYLPGNEVVDGTVDGGTEGLELTTRFLRELPSHLNPKGMSFVLLSSLNHPEKIEREYPEFSCVAAAKRSEFFEELQVLRLSLRGDFPA
jgi:release factor glutamine methyltransferase